MRASLRRAASPVASGTALLVACAGTSRPAPGLQIIVVADGIVAPTSYDDVEVTVEQEQPGGGNVFKTVYDESQPFTQAPLPISVALSRGASDDQLVRITASALLDGTVVVSRRAQLLMPTDRVADLYLVLGGKCLGPKCVGVDDMTCSPETGTCEPTTVTTADLPTYRPGDERGGRAPSFGGDAGSADATTDGSSNDATNVVDGPSDASVDGPSTDATLPIEAGDTRDGGDAGLCVVSAAGACAYASCATADDGVACKDDGVCNAPDCACATHVCADADWAQWRMPNVLPSPSPPTPLPNPASVRAPGDGTVRDAVTGLVWQQGVLDGFFTYDAAVAACGKLRLGPYADWRLPTLIELVSIVDVTRARPAIDGAAFPGTPSDFFWSVSPIVDNPGVAWCVNFGDGSVLTDARSNTKRARCVR